MNSFQSIDTFKKPSQLYAAHIIDSTGVFTTKQIAPLESFLTFTSHYPVKVVTKVKGIVVRTPALLLAAMLTTTSIDQKDILQTNRNLAKLVLRDSKGKRLIYPRDVPEIVEWVFRLIIAQHYKTITSIFKEIINSGNLDIVYIAENPNDHTGMIHCNGVFTGSNVYGEIIKNLVMQFKKDPESLLEVTPPNLENFHLLGMPVGTYKRSISVPDEKAAPKPSQVFKLGISKSEKFLSE